MKRGKDIKVGDAFYTLNKGMEISSKFGVVTKIKKGTAATFNNCYELSEPITIHVKTDYGVKEIKMPQKAYLVDYYLSNRNYNTLFVPTDEGECISLNKLLNLQYNYSRSIVRNDIRKALGLD